MPNAMESALTRDGDSCMAIAMFLELRSILDWELTCKSVKAAIESSGYWGWASSKVGGARASRKRKRSARFMAREVAFTRIVVHAFKSLVRLSHSHRLFSKQCFDRYRIVIVYSVCTLSWIFVCNVVYVRVCACLSPPSFGRFTRHRRAVKCDTSAT